MLLTRSHLSNRSAGAGGPSSHIPAASGAAEAGMLRASPCDICHRAAAGASRAGWKCCSWDSTGLTHCSVRFDGEWVFLHLLAKGNTSLQAWLFLAAFAARQPASLAPVVNPLGCCVRASARRAFQEGCCSQPPPSHRTRSEDVAWLFFSHVLSTLLPFPYQISLHRSEARL